MALFGTLKNIGTGLTEEVSQFKSIIGRMLLADTSPLADNFRKFGASFGAHDLDEFIEKAEEFYREGIASQDPSFTVVPMLGDRVAIDYAVEVRGIYTNKGKPIAFFRVDFFQSGYSNKTEELAAFKQNLHTSF